MRILVGIFTHSFVQKLFESLRIVEDARLFLVRSTLYFLNTSWDASRGAFGSQLVSNWLDEILHSNISSNIKGFRLLVMASWKHRPSSKRILCLLHGGFVAHELFGF